MKPKKMLANAIFWVAENLLIIFATILCSFIGGVIIADAFNINYFLSVIVVGSGTWAFLLVMAAIAVVIGKIFDWAERNK